MGQAYTEPSCDQAAACVVIPAYNHARTVGGVVQGALEHASTVLVCDDGSTDGSGEAAEKAGGILLRHETNRGKGAALRTLLEEASRRGFRYAISLDADGQHFPADLPVFARQAREEPGALFIGARDLCGARAPPSSEFGRKFSNFWLWFESGWRVDDSQCCGAFLNGQGSRFSRCGAGLGSGQKARCSGCSPRVRGLSQARGGFLEGSSLSHWPVH
jgi:glycosyltransferase involved in cell wall biosynthesis